VLVEKTERTLAADDPLIGAAKGAMQIIRERGRHVPRMSMKGPVIKGGDEEHADEEEMLEGDELGEECVGEGEGKEKMKRDLTLSVVHVLAEMSDFTTEKCLLEKAITNAGGLCIWLPKFHAPCNAIEYVWGNGKRRYREECDFTMATLRTSAFRAMMTTERATVRKYFRKSRAYQNALREGADTFSMHQQVAKVKKERYVSHRRPAPSHFKAE